MSTLRDSKVDLLSTRLIDFHGRRITNASPSVDNYDYVTKKELLDQIASLKDIIDNLKQGNTIIVNTSSGGEYGGGSIAEEFILTANTEITSANSPTAGIILVIKVSQDGTGGWQITWSATQFHSSTPVDIDVRANTIGLFSFVMLSDNLWHLIGYRYES
jgi:hypothetical protein